VKLFPSTGACILFVNNIEGDKIRIEKSFQKIKLKAPASQTSAPINKHCSGDDNLKSPQT
jgi:hypothetical protein